MASRSVTLVFVLCIYSAMAGDFKEDNGVLILDEDNIDEALSVFKNLLVEFYNPGCKKCKDIYKEYAMAAKNLADDKFEIKLGKVDATVEIGLKKRFKLIGTPTMILFRDGKPNDFRFQWTAEDIVSRLITTGLPTVQLKYVETANTFVETSDVVVIGFFKNQDSEDAKTFLKVAENFKDIPFGITSSSELYEKFKIDEDRVVLLKTFDELRNDFEGEINSSALLRFIRDSRLPIVNEYTRKKSKILFGEHIKFHMLLFLNLDEDHTKVLHTFSEAAEGFRGEMNFIYVDSGDYGFRPIMETCGLQAEDCPAICLMDMSKDLKKYKPESPSLDVKTIKSFAQSFFGGKLKRHVLTKQVPDDWNELPVKVLVGKNFNEVALDENKMVLVEFYDPWCIHCEAFAPIYRELGNKYEGRDDIVIAKMNIVKNEAENISVSRVPTIKLFPKGNSSAIDYKGEMSLEGLLQFLDTEAKGAAGVHKDDQRETSHYKSDQAKEEL